MHGMVAGLALALLTAPAATADELYSPYQPGEGTGDSLNASGYAVCERDAPWIAYDATLIDPDGEGGSREARLVFAKGAERVEVPLGEFDGDDRLRGRVLWPGAAVDDAGAGVAWPGWVQQDGAWIDVGEESLGWTREGATVTIAANPEAEIAVTYPPSTPGCTPGPRAAAAPGPDDPGSLAATGGSVFGPLVAGAAALGAGVLAMATGRRRGGRG
ncbi:hypothetical protein GCM10010921_26850 [Microbacterium album]|uniref:Cell wall protein n=2 Tax=Microbacterium album TaxID=2053191 RepID=A0A917IJ21_9MICO|nr:hypothetical protein GCM10010921_26850 [Microbacterium album]